MRTHYSGKIVINSDQDWTDARNRIEGGHATAKFAAHVNQDTPAGQMRL